MLFVKAKLDDAGKRDLFSMMASLLGSGLGLTSVLDILSQDDGASGSIVSGIGREVDKGRPLNVAMSVSGAFSGMDMSVVRVGEMSGSLVDTLSFMSEYYSRKVSHAKMIRSSLAYPLLILGFAVAVLVFMLLVIVPVFSDLYVRMGGELPGITRAMISLSRSLPAVLVAMGIMIAGFFVLRHETKETERYRSLKSSMLTGLPLVSGIVRADNENTFCRMMSLLLSSGVPVLQSIELAANAMTVTFYSDALAEIEEKVRYGDSFCDALGDYPWLFSHTMVTMVRVGEESNRLPEMFSRAADIGYAEMDTKFKRIEAYLQPVMILLVGAIVSVILIAMYLPMFRIGSVMLG